MAERTGIDLLDGCTLRWSPKEQISRPISANFHPRVHIFSGSPWKQQEASAFFCASFQRGWADREDLTRLPDPIKLNRGVCVIYSRCNMSVAISTHTTQKSVLPPCCDVRLSSALRFFLRDSLGSKMSGSTEIQLSHKADSLPPGPHLHALERSSPKSRDASAVGRLLVLQRQRQTSLPTA